MAADRIIPGRTAARALQKAFETDQEAFIHLVNRMLAQGQGAALLGAVGAVPANLREEFETNLWAVSETLSEDPETGGEGRDVRLCMVPVEGLNGPQGAMYVADIMEDAWFDLVPELSIRSCPFAVLPEDQLDPVLTRAALRAAMEGSMPEGWREVAAGERGLVLLAMSYPEGADAPWFGEGDGIREACDLARRRIVTEGWAVDSGRPIDALGLVLERQEAWKGMSEERGLPESLCRFFEHAASYIGQQGKPALGKRRNNRIDLFAMSGEGAVADRVEVDLWEEGVSEARLALLALQASGWGTLVVAPQDRDRQLEERSAEAHRGRPGSTRLVWHAAAPAIPDRSSPVTAFDPEAVRPKGSPFLCRETYPGQERRHRSTFR